jgi:hypothetical protein
MNTTERIKWPLYAAAIFLLFFYCSREKPISTEKVLVKVGDRTINANELKYRAEFIPHPIYPAQGKEGNKKIVLNNLILEKIFAIEAGEDYPLKKMNTYKAYMKGIEEQAMREQLYYKEAFEKVKLDTNDIKKAYRLAAREYKLGFYTINSDSIANKIKEKIARDPNKISEVFDQLGDPDKVPTWEAKFRDNDHYRIHEALYSAPLKQGQILGPIKIGDNQHIIMKVLDWKDNIILGGEDQQIRWNQVVEKMTSHEAIKKWIQYTSDIMNGKRIDFDKDIFKRLIDTFYAVMVATEEQQKKDIPQNFGEKKPFDLAFAGLLDEKDFMKQPFFKVDDQVWTVEDFKIALMSHPLVYRSYDMGTKKAFAHQFRLAIIDMIRDHFLTQKAYAEGLEKSDKVKRIEGMWEDAAIATKYRDDLIKKLAEGDTLVGKDPTYLTRKFDKYVTEMQLRYAPKIHVDLSEFEHIELTNIPMFALQPQVPYPVVVPAFPQISQDADLSYLMSDKTKK